MKASKLVSGPLSDPYDSGSLPFYQIQLEAPKPTKTTEILKTWEDHIRKRRLMLQLPQKDTGRVVGVDETTVRNWEHKRTTPTLRYLLGAIGFLGYDPSFGGPETLGEKVLKYLKFRGVN